MTGLGPTDTITHQRESYDPLRGDGIIEIHEGTEAAMRGIKNALRVAAPFWNVEVEDTEEPVWRCVIRSPDEIAGGESQAVTMWEIWSNEINKSIYENPRTFKTLDENIIAIKEGLKNNSSQYDITDKFVGSANQIEVAAELLLHLQKGVTDYLDTQFVLRRTITTSATYKNKVPMSNINRVWSRDQLINTESIPTDILFSLSTIPNPAVASSDWFGDVVRTER